VAVFALPYLCFETIISLLEGLQVPIMISPDNTAFLCRLHGVRRVVPVSILRTFRCTLWSYVKYRGRQHIGPDFRSARCAREKATFEAILRCSTDIMSVDPEQSIFTNKRLPGIQSR
jgi:hypothetical protein